MKVIILEDNQKRQIRLLTTKDKEMAHIVLNLRTNALTYCEFGTENIITINLDKYEWITIKEIEKE